MRGLTWSFLCLAHACAPAGVIALRSGDVVQVTADGAPFASVHVAAEPRPFVFPLLAPGGVPVTRGFPMVQVAGETNDHPHHQSLWFAHGDVNGFDFWHGTGHRERIVLDGACELDGARVLCRYRWLVDDDTLVATEVRELLFAAGGGVRTVDVTIELRPGTTPLVLGDTKEGTFALRVHDALRTEGYATGILSNSEGRLGKDVWGQRARWIDASGTVDGVPVGVAIFDHPANPSHPTWWHARTYGLLAANAFGAHDFARLPAGAGARTVPVGSSITFRYRVVLHGGGFERERIDGAYREWVAR